jgi:CheY-like chemotaxis protein
VGKVLIVDDHAEQCRPLMRLIQMMGHTAQHEPGGKEALAAVQGATRPDLVVCDVMMPDMDGAEVLRRIKQDQTTREVPVVMYTAVNDSNYVQHLRDLGADDVWLKARIGFDAIEAKLRTLLPNDDAPLC